MANTIKIKNAASGTPSSLVAGELAVNTANGNLWVGNTAGNGVIHLNPSVSTSYLPLAGGTLTGGLLGTYFRMSDYGEIRADDAELYFENAANNRYWRWKLAEEGSTDTFNYILDHYNGTSTSDVLKFTPSNNAIFSGTITATGGTLSGNLTLATSLSSSSGDLELHRAGSNRLTLSGSSVVINDSGANIDFRVEGDGDANLIRTDASNDRVGIKTNAPRATVDFGAGSGDGTLSQTISEYQSVYEAPQGTGDIGRNIGFAVTTNGISAAINAFDDGGSNATGLSFSTGVSGNITEYMRLSYNGKLGLGTASPAQKLSVFNGKISVSDGYNIGSHDGETGMYVDEDNDIRFQVGGSLLMTLQEHGKLGLGRSSPNARIDILDPTDGGISWSTFLRVGRRSGDSTNELELKSLHDGSDEVDGFGLFLHNNECLAVDNSKRLYLNALPPGTYAEANFADNLVLGRTDNHAGITIRSGNEAAGPSHAGSIYFADGVTGDQKYRGYIEYNHNGDVMSFGAGAANRLKLSSSEVTINEGSNNVDFRVEGDGDANLIRTDASNDRVGIKTASPSYTFHCVGTGYFSQSVTLSSGLTAAGAIQANGGFITERADNNNFITMTATGNETWTIAGRSGSDPNDYLDIGATGGGKISIHESGALGIKNAAPAKSLHISAGDGDHLMLHYSGSTSNSGGVRQFFQRSTGTEASPTGTSDGDIIGTTSYVAYAPSGSSYRNSAAITVTRHGAANTVSAPAKIAFATPGTADDTLVDRLTILPGGNVFVGDDTDVYANIGRARVGFNTDGSNGDSDYASFSHRDSASPTSYALMQSAAGATFLNSASNQNLFVRRGNATKMTLSSSTLSLATNTEVYGYLFVDGATDLTKLQIDNSSGHVRNIDFTRNATGNSNATARIQVSEPGSTHTSNMKFYTSNASGSAPNLVEAMRINESQHVSVNSTDLSGYGHFGVAQPAGTNTDGIAVVNGTNSFRLYVDDAGMRRLNAGSTSVVDFNSSSFNVYKPLTVGANGSGHDVRFWADNGKFWEWDESMELTRANDGVKSVWGSGDDLQIYHDGTNTYMQQGTNAGNLNFSYKGGAKYSAIFKKDADSGKVELFYDGSKKFETDSSGCTISNLLNSGRLTATNDVNYRAANISEINSSISFRITKTRLDQTKAIAMGCLGSSNSDTGLQCYDTSDNSANTFKIQPFGGTTTLGANHFILSGGVFSWGNSANAGQMSWDTGKAYLYGQSGHALCMGSNGNGNYMHIKTNGETHFGASSGNQGVAIHGNSSGYGSIVGVNRAGNTYRALEVNGSQVELKASGTAKLTVTSSAVGIGTTVPNSEGLEIVQPSADTSFNLNDQADSILVLRNSDSGSINTGRFCAIQMKINSSSAAAEGTIRTQFAGDGDSDLIFSTTKGGTGYDRMTLDEDGHLEVSAGHITTSNSTNGYIAARTYLQLTASATPTSGSYIGKLYAYNDTNAMLYYKDGGDTAHALHSASDYRLKENVTDYSGDDAVALVKAAQVKRFDFKENRCPEEHRMNRVGFLAHELQEAGCDLGAVVSLEKDAVDNLGNPRMQSVDYKNLVPVLWAALQDALKRIEDLENK